MLFRRDPDVAVTPLAQVSQLLHLVMVLLGVVLDGQTRWIEHANVAAQAEEDAGTFESQQA